MADKLRPKRVGPNRSMKILGGMSCLGVPATGASVALIATAKRCEGVSQDVEQMRIVAYTCLSTLKNAPLDGRERPWTRFRRVSDGFRKSAEALSGRGARRIRETASGQKPPHILSGIDYRLYGGVQVGAILLRCDKKASD